MKQIVTQVEQVLSLVHARIATFRNRLREKNDDTLEAQAQTFRIWMWASAAGLSLIVVGSAISMAKPEATTSPVNRETSILDQLPEGYVIAPIDPTNLDSLDSIFDQQGYADLYRAGADNERGQRIGRGLPLIRAPRNPRRFAVIVPETQAALLGELNESVLVVLRNGPPKAGGRDEPQKSPRKSKKRGVLLLREATERIDVIEEDLNISGDDR